MKYAYSAINDHIEEACDPGYEYMIEQEKASSKRQVAFQTQCFNSVFNFFVPGRVSDEQLREEMPF